MSTRLSFRLLAFSPILAQNYKAITTANERAPVGSRWSALIVALGWHLFRTRGRDP